MSGIKTMTEPRHKILIGFSVPKSSPYAGRIAWLAYQIADGISALTGGITVHEPETCLWHEDGNSDPPYFDVPSEEVGRIITFVTNQDLEKTLDWVKRVFRSEVDKRDAPVEWVHVEHWPVRVHHFNAQK